MTKCSNEQTEVWDFDLGICLDQLEIRPIRNFRIARGVMRVTACFL